MPRSILSKSPAPPEPQADLVDRVDFITLHTGRIESLMWMIAAIGEHASQLDEEHTAILCGIGVVARHVADLQRQISDHAVALHDATVDGAR